MNRLELTKDLSPTLYSEEFNQTYHSIHGAIAESLHVFIKHGLEDVARMHKSVKIFEMGFGTGLNAALTYQYAVEYQLDITYYAIEKYPVDAHLLDQFQTQNLDVNKKLSLIHDLDWDIYHKLNNFNFFKFRGDLLSHHMDQQFNLIYFDAFSPNTQPELWTEEVFKKMYDLLLPNGILTTYCAKGQVKRNLKAAGFVVESPPGPIGKREMTKAIKRPTPIH